jgi:hypothetical protein
MSTVQAGRVTNRKGAKLHHPNCRILAHRPLIPATIRDITTDDAPLVCKLCRHLLHTDAEHQSHIEAARSHRYSEARVHAAVALAEALESPAQRVARAQRRAEFDRNTELLITALALAA